jgi:hypothetical protein
VDARNNMTVKKKFEWDKSTDFSGLTEGNSVRAKAIAHLIKENKRLSDELKWLEESGTLRCIA